MDSPLPQVISLCERALVNGNGVTPFSQQTVVLTKQAYIELTWQAHYWQAQYEQLVERETALKAEIAAHQATIRALTQRLYGTKSEKSTRLKPAPGSEDNRPAVRGPAAGTVPPSP
jgi:hypothetical protein